MKFLVDELPYYESFCPLYMMCGDNASEEKCPKYWNKDKVCSHDNPHECCLLIEAGGVALKGSHICQTCRYFEDLDVLTSPCSTCFGASNWEDR